MSEHPGEQYRHLLLLLVAVEIVCHPVNKRRWRTNSGNGY